MRFIHFVLVVASTFVVNPDVVSAQHPTVASIDAPVTVVKHATSVDADATQRLLRSHNWIEDDAENEERAFPGKDICKELLSQGKSPTQGKQAIAKMTQTFTDAQRAVMAEKYVKMYQKEYSTFKTA
ncbi:hypothetical protein PHMEG_00028805 [Phytophthora megakarya]|uniref:RxLR effector protein n=1 Tax=Phytophthora megakarya TaxID=4795 RepID=A0A225V2D5_9STRA|nr:hypothetical protein PHMEG_00028805 [Phytophthora megakarya]